MTVNDTDNNPTNDSLQDSTVDTASRNPNTSKRRRRIVLIGLVSGILLLAVAGVLWFEYIFNKQVARLPLIREALALDKPLYSTSIYGVDRPLDIAVTPDGQYIYVGEGDGDRLIKILDAKGNIMVSFSPPQSTKSTRLPMYLALGPDGSVYVADQLRSGIDVYSAWGEYQTTITPVLPDGENYRTQALTVDKEGNIYVADAAPPNRKQRILVIKKDGTVIRQIGSDLSFAAGVAVDDIGRVFVADSQNGKIRVFNADGQQLDETNEAGGGVKLGLPRGLTIDREGRLLAVDTFDHGVKFYAAGVPLKLVFTIGTYGNGDGQFYYPSGIAVDRQGKIYVADRENNRIQIWF